MEEALFPEQGALAEDPTQQKNDLAEEPALLEAMKVTTINSEGSVTRSMAKACSEESTDNSVEELEPHSRKRKEVQQDNKGTRSIKGKSSRETIQPRFPS